MTCCPATMNTFSFEEETTMAYAGEYGAIPKVEVIYNIDGVWQSAGVFTTVEVSTTSITVKHGGIASGVIKVW